MITARSFLTGDIVPRSQLLIWTTTALASGLAVRNSVDRKYMQVWDLFDEYTRDPHSERGSGVFRKMVDWILSKAK